MFRLNRGLFTLEDEIDYELGAAAKKKKPAAKKAPAKKPPAKKPPAKAKKPPPAKAKKPAPKPKAPVKAKPPPKAKPKPAPKAKAPPKAKPKPAPKAVPKPKPKVVAKAPPRPPPKAPAPKPPPPDGSMATLKARLATPEPAPPVLSPLAPMAQASPYVPADMETPEALPAEEPAEEVTEEATEEVTEEESTEEEAPEEPSEEEPAEEASEEEGVELGQLVQHVQKTIKPTLGRFRGLKLTTGQVPAKAQAAVRGACQCSAQTSNKVRAKLDKKLRARGYPSGAGDKLLAGISELTKRLDNLARAKAQTVTTPKGAVAARMLRLTRDLPLTHPVRCRAVRLMLTCTP